MYRQIACVLLLLVLSRSVSACLWDHDTLQSERARFPSVLELITGKFLRHSPEFYEWRIEDRKRRIAAEPLNVELADDLAVAYDKLGRHDDAIREAQRIEAQQPGRYETAANLGTFYFHNRQFHDGLPWIARALEINPDAHFGRETYQKLLVEYLLERSQGGELRLPVSLPSDMPGTLPAKSFVQFLETDSKELSEKELVAATTGILGMLRFGHYDSPVLLEALGALLAHGRVRGGTDAKLLSARAYLQASYQVPAGPARAGYRQLAQEALFLQSVETPSDKLLQVERDFQQELAEAKRWYAELEAREAEWIGHGLNPEVEFDKLYASEPTLVGLEQIDSIVWKWGRPILLGGVLIGLVLARNLLSRQRSGPSKSASIHQDTGTEEDCHV